MAEAAKKAPSLELVPVPAIQQRILLVREQHVMVDEDLAELYGVATRRLIEQVKRNRVPFPPDFMFQLSRDRVGTPGVISGAPARVVGEVNAVVG